MSLEDFKITLDELAINLKNSRVIGVLNNVEFDLNKLKNAIRLYQENSEAIWNISSDKELEIINKKAKELLEYTNESNFRNFVHPFINAANFIIEKAPKATEIASSKVVEAKISEEEFSRRFDRLIDLLNFEIEESNLILETPSDKVPFKLFKNSESSIVVETKGGTKNTRTKDKLIGITYRGESDEKRSYDKVIIEKILDNSIFDFFGTQSKKDLSEALKNKLEKQEDEIIILKDKLEKLQKDDEEFKQDKEALKLILSNSTIAKKEYEDAKKAALDDAMLEHSSFYWEEKKKKHLKLFGVSITVAIFLIAILILGLKSIVVNHQIDISADIANKNASKEINKSSADFNKTNNDSLLGAINYSNLAWYALMIFASSSVFWIIRITMKIALSNLHLSEDAHERVVMIKTYLSFIQEGHGLEEKDKQLIMSSLFRPSNIGIIQDESSVTVADIVSSLKGK